LQVQNDELKQAYEKLAEIKNAIEASANRDTVRISITEEPPGWISTSIWNREPIPEELHYDFGKKYFTTGKRRGTGLGVYSAVLMTEIQGGTFRWTSSEEKGTTITVTLPAAH
jgi:signal transduction histidine kinase